MLVFYVLTINLYVSTKLSSAKTYESPYEVRELLKGDPIELLENAPDLNFPYIKGEIPKDAFCKLTETTTLKISYRVSYVEPGAFSGLVNLFLLDLSWNDIRKLTSDAFSGLNELRTLNLKGNKIKRIEPGSFASLESLQHLNLELNLELRNLKDDIFYGLISLVSLNLNRCQISQIEENAFSDLTSLRNLSLSHNRISDISVFVLKTCPILTDLDLSYNRIEKVGDNILHSVVGKLKVINISENPCVCNSDTTKGETRFRYGQKRPEIFGDTLVIRYCEF